MDTYLKSRKELIASERALRSGADRVSASNELERQADAIVRKIRAQEAKTIWHVEHKEYNNILKEIGAPDQEQLQYGAHIQDEFAIAHPDISNFFPGMPFLTARGIIQETKLFDIVNKMPKGGILHSHLDSTVDVGFLMNLMLAQPGMHIRTPEPVTKLNFKTLLPEFLQMSPNHVAQANNIVSESYPSNEWVAYKVARDNFSADLGGPSGFDRFIRGTMTIEPNQAYKEYNSHRRMWDKLASTFHVSNGILRSLPIFKAYTKEYFRASISNGISYVEPRVNFFSRTFYTADGVEVPNREFMLVFKAVLEETKAELKAQGREKEFVGAKAIYTSVKVISAEDMEWYYENCIALKQEFPDLIAGFDLVGPEEFVKPLMVYVEGLLRFKKKIEELQLDLPFILHAGETLGDGDEVDNNLYDALLLDTKRIGHGFSLIKHPLLMDICKARGITLELCPISNELLRLSASMPAHPMPALIAHGVEVVISNDDPSAFGNLGLSWDFFQVIVSSEVTGLSELGVIARRSLEVSMLELERKKDALANWDAAWNSFLQSVCDRYGHVLG